VITVTDNAASALLDLLRTKGSGDGLRLAVEKGGCAGLQYAMTLGEQQPDDLVAEYRGAKVFVDPASGEFLKGSVLDYEDTLAGAGFRIINPGATRSCGCGTSFEPAAAAPES
jgi:iron-sulfur cluster assembly protein